MNGDQDQDHDDTDEATVTKVELTGTIGRSVADEPVRRKAMIEWDDSERKR